MSAIVVGARRRFHEVALQFTIVPRRSFDILPRRRRYSRLHSYFCEKSRSCVKRRMLHKGTPLITMRQGGIGKHREGDD